MLWVTHICGNYSLGVDSAWAAMAARIHPPAQNGMGAALCLPYFERQTGAVSPGLGVTNDGAFKVGRGLASSPHNHVSSGLYSFFDLKPEIYPIF